MTLLRQFSERLSALNALQQPQLPPVQKWNPPLSGDMDMRIDSAGQWWHEGETIERQPLVRLFASILKREGEEYFLVTPVEKWRIQVEDAPLLVVDYLIKEVSAQQQILLATSTGDQFPLDAEHPLRMAGEKPYVRVRDNLDALIHRNVFYPLVNLAIEQSGEGVPALKSAGESFALA